MRHHGFGNGHLGPALWPGKGALPWSLRRMAYFGVVLVLRIFAGVQAAPFASDGFALPF
jgi:hypothetical protein